MRTIEERLTVLERASARRGRAVAALSAVLLALVTMGAAGGPADVLQARRIEVVDGSGTVLLALEARDGRATLEMQNETGERTALLTNGADGGALALYDALAHHVVLLGAESGGGTVETSTAGGHTLVKLGSGGATGGAIATYAGGGHKLVELGATSDGDGTLVTYDAKGGQLLALAAASHGSGRLVAYDGGREQATWPDK